MAQKKKGKVVSSFDGFLAESGMLEDCQEPAIKQILAGQITTAMEKDRITKAAMALRMRTSRRALDRLLDPANTSVTLHTLQRATIAIGRPQTITAYPAVSAVPLKSYRSLLCSPKQTSNYPGSHAL